MSITFVKEPVPALTITGGQLEITSAPGVIRLQRR